MGKAGFGAGLRSTLHTSKDAERGLAEEFRWMADTNRRVAKSDERLSDEQWRRFPTASLRERGYDGAIRPGPA